MIFRYVRVIFALLVTFVGACDRTGDPRQSAEKATQSGPVIVVEATYPGANAAVVADTIAAAVEQQVAGVENLLRMESISTSDGRYALALTFEPGTKLDEAQVLVQNRVAVAEPMLPDEARRAGVTVKKQSPVLMLVALSSSTGDHDTLALSNYLNLKILDELKRLPGVGDLKCFGQTSPSLRVWIDPDKLAARELTQADVVKAIEGQNLKVSTGKGGQPAQLIQKTSGHLTLRQIETIVIRTSVGGNVVYLKDVARVESITTVESSASFDGKPCVALGIYPTGGTSPKEVSRAVADKLEKLRTSLPKGMQLDVAFDFTSNLETPRKPTAPEYLLLDLQLTDGASAERTSASLSHCEELLRGVRGVQDVLTLSGNPFERFRGGPCIAVRLEPADKRKGTREEIMRAIRAKSEQIPNALVRLRTLSHKGSSPAYGYPVDLAVSGPDLKKVRELAEKLGERLKKSPKLTDLWVDQQSKPRPYLRLDIDLDKAKKLGVSLKAVSDTLQIYFGLAQVGDFNKFGGKWELTIQMDSAQPGKAEDLKELYLRNDKREIVSLGAFASIRTIAAPPAIRRLNSQPMVEVSANPATDVSLEQAKSACETAFEAARKELKLPAEYRLTWLQ